jgi:hypothetical protein
MRRHPPHLIALSRTDKAELKRLVQDGRTEQRVARRARVLLAMEQSKTVVQTLADQVQMTREGIWHLCRRYEQLGRSAVFDLPRGGRPRVFSPLGPGASRAVGLL